MNHNLFDWDFDNITHIANHDVIPEEAEEAMLGCLLFLETQEVDGEIRIVEVGSTRRGRVLQLTYTMRGSRIRIVTAYDPNKRLVWQYHTECGES